MPVMLGGCFAPPLTPEKLANYRAMASAAPPEIGEAMSKLCDMVAKFQETPDSSLPDQPTNIPGLSLVPLEPDEVQRIWDWVPWGDELKLYAARFETISPTDQKPLRDAAHHLLWYGWELFNDREPLTRDKLPA